MSETTRVEIFDPDLALFETRMRELDALGAQDVRWQSAMLELRTAADQLRLAYDGLTHRASEETQRRAMVDAERQLMRSVFRDLPVPVFLLDGDGRIRRANQRCADLLGVGPDYLAGRPFVDFLVPEARPGFRADLAACVRDQLAREVRTTVVHEGRPRPVGFQLGPFQPPSDPRPLVALVASVEPAEAARQAPVEPLPARVDVARQDLMDQVVRVLLDEYGDRPAALLRRTGGVLCAAVAGQAVIDVLDGEAVRRTVVCDRAEILPARVVRDLERALPDTAPVVARVLGSGTSVLQTHVGDVEALGRDERGVAFVTLLGAHSLLSVPIVDGGPALGVITLTRSQPQPPFSLADLGTLEEIGRLVGRSLKRRRPNGDAGGLVWAPAPFVPVSLPRTPALDVAWAHHEAGQTEAVNLPAVPFFDYYDAPGGWGVVLGSVQGDGPERQAYVTMIQQWARLLGSGDLPAEEVLGQLDEALRRLHRPEPAASVVVVDMRYQEGGARVRLASAGHLTSQVLRADGRVQRSDGGGTMLNGEHEARVHTDDDELHAGDMLLLYSNEFGGLQNAAGESFLASGELANVAADATGRSARAVVDGMYAALGEFGKGGRGSDSVVVAVRCTGRPR